MHAIACAAILATGCSGELAERPPASDPTAAAAAEAPFRAPPRYQPDPLLSLAPPESAEAPPTGSEQVHSPTAAPPGNPPLREAPGAKTPPHQHHHGGMQHMDMHDMDMHPGAPSPSPSPNGGGR